MQEAKRHQFNPCVGKILWNRKWQPTLVFLLENPIDRGAWWATVYGVAKSQTLLSVCVCTHTHTHTHNQTDAVPGTMLNDLSVDLCYQSPSHSSFAQSSFAWNLSTRDTCNHPMIHTNKLRFWAHRELAQGHIASIHSIPGFLTLEPKPIITALCLKTFSSSCKNTGGRRRRVSECGLLLKVCAARVNHAVFSPPWTLTFLWTFQEQPLVG